MPYYAILKDPAHQSHIQLGIRDPTSSVPSVVLDWVWKAEANESQRLREEVAQLQEEVPYRRHSKTCSKPEVHWLHQWLHSMIFAMCPLLCQSVLWCDLDTGTFSNVANMMYNTLEYFRHTSDPKHGEGLINVYRSARFLKQMLLQHKTFKNQKIVCHRCHQIDFAWADA